jgi:hypothetical protein
MLAFAVTTLLLAPWNGADLPTATRSAVKYQLTVKDAPGTTVHLRATHVQTGWIAAFCDNRVCSPGQVHEAIPASGTMVLQFELIREEDSAAARSDAVIESDTGQSVRVRPNARPVQ